MTRTTFIKLIKIILTTFVATIIITFAIWRSLNYARGPHITITQPINGAEISENYTILIGQVERVKHLLINGSNTNIDEKGIFTDNIVVFPGINIITVIAQDQFGRSIKEQITLVGKNRITKIEKPRLSNTGTTSQKSVGNNISSSTTP